MEFYHFLLLCHTTKEIILSKNFTKNVASKLFLGSFVFIDIYAQPQLFGTN